MPSPEDLDEEFSDRYSTDKTEDEEDEDKEFLPAAGRKLPSPGAVEDDDEEEEEEEEDSQGGEQSLK